MSDRNPALAVGTIFGEVRDCAGSRGLRDVVRQVKSLPPAAAAILR
jgi:hypothetical protein